MQEHTYSFVKRFELDRLVKRTVDTVPLGILLDTLKSCLSEDVVRNIIHEGIKSVRIKSNDPLTITNKLHFHLSRRFQPETVRTPAPANRDEIRSENSFEISQPQNATGTKPTARSVSHTESLSSSKFVFENCDHALSITHIMCKVFSFLDFNSKNACKMVNSDWLKNAYQRESHYHLDLNDLTKTFFRGHREIRWFVGVSNAIKDLSCFANVKRLTLVEWASPERLPIAKYFRSLPNAIKDNQLKKITILSKYGGINGHLLEPHSQYASVVVDLLIKQATSVENIEVIMIDDRSPYGEEFEKNVKCFTSIVKGLQNVVFPRLKRLDVQAAWKPDTQEFANTMSTLMAIRDAGQQGCHINFGRCYFFGNSTNDYFNHVDFELVWKLCKGRKDTKMEGSVWFARFHRLRPSDLMMRLSNKLKKIGLIEGETNRIDWIPCEGHTLSSQRIERSDGKPRWYLRNGGASNERADFLICVSSHQIHIEVSSLAAKLTIT